MLRVKTYEQRHLEVRRCKPEARRSLALAAGSSAAASDPRSRAATTVAAAAAADAGPRGLADEGAERQVGDQALGGQDGVGAGACVVGIAASHDSMAARSYTCGPPAVGEREGAGERAEKGGGGGGREREGGRTALYTF